MDGFLKRIAGSQDHFFDTANPRIDVSVICHEVRSPGIATGDKISISFRDISSKDPEIFVQVGELCQIKSLPLSTTVQVRVWVSQKKFQAKQLSEHSTRKRACGEIRIPIQRLANRFEGALYYTWVLLDSPGPQDSTFIHACRRVEGDVGTFDQALQNGPRQPTQPKACFSMFRSEDVNATGKILFTSEAPRRDRIQNWGLLLRSQQQHLVMCNMQHAYGMQQVRDRSSLEITRLAHIDLQEQRRVHEIEALQVYLADRQRGLQLERSRQKDRGDEWGLEMRQREDRMAQQSAEMVLVNTDRALRIGDQNMPTDRQHDILHGEMLRIQMDMADQHALASNLKQELEELQGELLTLDEEAQRKIVAANERIWSLEQERDEAVNEAEAQSANNQDLLERVEELNAEKAQLAEHKETLLEIIEDLHQTCTNAGLPLG